MEPKAKVFINLDPKDLARVLKPQTEGVLQTLSIRYYNSLAQLSQESAPANPFGLPLMGQKNLGTKQLVHELSCVQYVVAYQ